ncbi:hypothetical protein BDY24DRAFT_28888 [Mrakia frigida]|uniref:uncharacterized protein n=1 Tax=Mrakia frigida TaxID=29902 RepID=UPI003FCBFD06
MLSRSLSFSFSSAESLPEEALTDPSFSLADHIASRAPPSSDNFEPPTLDASRAGRESEAWEVLDEVAEEVEGGSWKSAENGEGGGEFGTRKATSTSLSKSTAKSFKSFLKRSQHGSLSSSSHSSKRSAAPIVHSQPEQDESMDVDEDLPPSPHIPSPAPGVARALRPSLAGTEPTIRMVQSSSTSSLASTARGAVSPPRMGNRMLVDSPFCITTSISSSSLYPTLPTKPEEKEDSIPGSFPSASSSSNNTPKRLASPPPFVFGNPRHSISNQQFRSPTIAAASMTAAGLSMREVMEEEMRKRMEEKGLVTAGGAAGLALPSWMVALGQPGGTVAASGVVGAVAGSPMKRRFDDLHEKEFAKMPSIADHYTAKRSINPSSTKSKPTASSSSRAIANGRRPSSLIAAGAPRYRPSLAAQAEGPSSKRVKVSFSATPAQASNLERAGSISSTSKGKEREVQVDTRKEEDAEMEREKEAIKRKLAMSKARRSSVAGRRLSGGKAKPAREFRDASPLSLLVLLFLYSPSTRENFQTDSASLFFGPQPRELPRGSDSSITESRRCERESRRSSRRPNPLLSPDQPTPQQQHPVPPPTSSPNRALSPNSPLSSHQVRRRRRRRSPNPRSFRRRRRRRTRRRGSSSEERKRLTWPLHLLQFPQLSNPLDSTQSQLPPPSPRPRRLDPPSPPSTPTDPWVLLPLPNSLATGSRQFRALLPPELLRRRSGTGRRSRPVQDRRASIERPWRWFRHVQDRLSSLPQLHSSQGNKPTEGTLIPSLPRFLSSHPPSQLIRKLQPPFTLPSLPP